MNKEIYELFNLSLTVLLCWNMFLQRMITTSYFLDVPPLHFFDSDVCTFYKASLELGL